MSSFAFYFKNRPGHESRFNTLKGLVIAAASAGMKVAVFMDLDAVWASSVNQRSGESLVLPKDNISEMIDMGVDIYVCSVCSAPRGVGDADAHISGVNMISPEASSKLFSEYSVCISL